MAKGKKKGGLSGVSRFVFESMSSTPANSDATKATSSESPKAAQSRTLNEPPMKKRKGNDGTSVAHLSDHEEQLAGWVEKYSAVGLVPHYTQAEQVPEHLQKCRSSLRCPSSIMLMTSSRLLSTSTILLVVRLASRVSS